MWTSYHYFLFQYQNFHKWESLCVNGVEASPEVEEYFLVPTIFLNSSFS